MLIESKRNFMYNITKLIIPNNKNKNMVQFYLVDNTYLLNVIICNLFHFFFGVL